MGPATAGGWAPEQQEEIRAWWHRHEALRPIARHFDTDMAKVPRVLLRTGGRRQEPQVAWNVPPAGLQFICFPVEACRRRPPGRPGA